MVGCLKAVTEFRAMHGIAEPLIFGSESTQWFREWEEPSRLFWRKERHVDINMQWYAQFNQRRSFGNTEDRMVYFPLSVRGEDFDLHLSMSKSVEDSVREICTHFQLTVEEHLAPSSHLHRKVKAALETGLWFKNEGKVSV